MIKVFTNLKRNAALISLNIIILILFLADSVGKLHLPLVERLESQAYDARMRFGMHDDLDPRIVIVDIDEKSLAAEGRWPWSRNKMAKLVDLLFDHYHISLAGFDVVFAEPDKSSGLETLEILAENELSNDEKYQEQVAKFREQLDYDAIFAKSMEGRPVVLGYYFNEDAEGSSSLKSGVLPVPALSIDDFKIKPFAKKAIGYGANLPIFQNHSRAAGHFNPHIDVDGVVRRIPMLIEFEENFFESLSLSMTREILGVKKIEPVYVKDISQNFYSLEWLRIGNIRIPVDDQMMALVPYRGKQKSFPYVSATDILQEMADPQILKNAIVLVGTSAPGLFDLRSTPVQNKYPGVEIHANMIAGILDEKIREIPEYVMGVEFLHLLIIGLIITLILPFVTPVWSISVSSGLLLLSVGINYYVWEELNIVFPIASIIAMILVLLLVNMSYGFFFERRIKGQITDLFGQYVPPELVDEMSNDPSSYTREAEEREMTVLFSDVRGFTTLSEGLNPKELSSLMNEFLSELTRVIHEHRGTIDKYMGDAIMAFWGAPVRDQDHDKNAIKAGLAMVNRMYSLKDEFKNRGWPPLAIGVGINTGNMSVGNMGSRFRTAYTVIGDEVNLGSRLEGLTKEYGVDMIVGENTRERLHDFVFRELDLVRVKGKHKPVAIYEPIGDLDEVSKEELDELELYQQALQSYRSQDWNLAEVFFNHLKQDYKPRIVYDVYLLRLNVFRKEPPGDDWDGVFTFTKK